MTQKLLLAGALLCACSAFGQAPPSGSCQNSTPQVTITGVGTYGCVKNLWVLVAPIAPLYPVGPILPNVGPPVNPCPSVGWRYINTATEVESYCGNDFAWHTPSGAGGGITGPGTTNAGYIPIWGDTVGDSLGAGKAPTGSGADLVTAAAAGTTGNCAQWASGNLGDSGAPCGTGTAAAWGSITGTLSSQTDLQSALSGKQATGNYPAAPGSTTIGFIPTWTSSTGATIGVGLQETGTGTRLVSASAVGTSGNCAQWLSGNLTDSGSPCGSGAGSVTWPATGDLVISNSTSSPAGLVPINGDCVIGSGGAWVAGSCAGGSFTLPNGVLASRPTSPASPTLYLATDQPILSSLNIWNGTAWAALINIDSSGLTLNGGSTLGVDQTIIPCLACANVLPALNKLGGLAGTGSSPTRTNVTGTVAVNTGSTNVAGSLTSSTSGAVTFTLTWASLSYTTRAVCHFVDETTNADSIKTTQATPPTTTTLTATGTTVTGDIISYSCSGY